MHGLHRYLAATLFVVSGCAEDEKPQPLLPGLPINVASISLQKTVWTASETILANGVSAMQFQINYLDAAGGRVQVGVFPMEIWINGTTKLPTPYLFTTQEEGTYTFSLRTADGESYLEKAATVRAITPPAMDPHQLRVIFHYFVTPTSQLSTSQRRDLAQAYADSLTIVNDAFANLRGSKDPNAIDANIKFYLATKDPDGELLQHAGLDFIHAPRLTREWENIEQHVSGDHYWSPSRYLNVWIVDLEDMGGLAAVPDPNVTDTNNDGGYYGVFVDRDYVTGPVLAHEFGHMLNLEHVFSQTTCYDADRCDDTQSYSRGPNAYFPMGLIRIGCNGERFAATNYMDYHFSANTTFTADQVVRMHHVLHKTPFLPARQDLSTGRRDPESLLLRGWLRKNNSRIIID